MKATPTAANDTSEEAVDWAIRRAAGLTSAERLRLERWLAADSSRARELAEAEQTVGFLRQPRATDDTDAIIAALRARQNLRRARRQRWVITGASLAAAAALMFAILPDRTTETPSTVVARPDTQTLPDGSTVRLNAGAEISTDFTPALRRVTLRRGEALFSVRKDATRPFIVTASGLEVRAVGTVFSVKSAAQTVDVLVTEGKVAVARVLESVPVETTTQVSEPIYVTAGNRLRVPIVAVPEPPAVQAVTTPEISQALAWVDQRVEFSGTPLGEAVDLFNRQNHTQVVLIDPEMTEKRISGIFWKDDPDSFAKLLELSLNLSARRESGRIELRSR